MKQELYSSTAFTGLSGEVDMRETVAGEEVYGPSTLTRSLIGVSHKDDKHI